MSKKLIQQHTKQVFNRMNTADKPVVSTNSIPIQISNNPLAIAKQVLRSKQEAAIKLEQQEIAKEQEALRIITEKAAKQREDLRIEQERILKEKEILRLKAIEEDTIRLQEEQAFKSEQEQIAKEKELLKIAKEKANEEQEVLRIEHEKIAKEYEALRIVQEEIAKEKVTRVSFEEDLSRAREAISEDYERKVLNNFSPRTETTASIEGIEDNIEFDNQVQENSTNELPVNPHKNPQSPLLLPQAFNQDNMFSDSERTDEYVEVNLSGAEEEFIELN